MNNVRSYLQGLLLSETYRSKIESCVIAQFHINALFGFEVSAISKFICGTPVYQRQRSVSMATNFGSKLL